MSDGFAQPKSVSGLMFIGDPHLESRQHGFRKDDFPHVALKKFAWCLDFARQNDMQPFLLGDLFQFPRENPNWLMTEIIQLLDQPLPAIYGNHDVRENQLKKDDSIKILYASGCLIPVTLDRPWRGYIGDEQVVVGGVDWGQDRYLKKLNSDSFAKDSFDPTLSICMTHHDILIPGYEEGGNIRPRSIDGIDIVMNGHIHRRLEPVIKESTHWITAGNILRQKRSDLSRSHIPAVPCVVPASSTMCQSKGDVHDGSSNIFDLTVPGRKQGQGDWAIRWISIPHAPFDDVFHSQLEVADDEIEQGSDFVADLRELIQRKTDTGAGLVEYLENNMDQFSTPVAEEIMYLRELVTANLNRDQI